jgi:hypothetical protein
MNALKMLQRRNQCRFQLFDPFDSILTLKTRKRLLDCCPGVLSAIVTITSGLPLANEAFLTQITMASVPLKIILFNAWQSRLVGYNIL